MTIIAWVVSLSLHRLPDEAEDVRVTLPPLHKVVGPDTEMVGAGEIGFTVTTTGADGGLVHPPTVCVTVYEPADETVIL